MAAINLSEALERVLRVFFVLPERFQAVVAPAVIPAPIAQGRGAGRVLLHFVIPFRLEKSLQRFGLGGWRRRCALSGEEG